MSLARINYDSLKNFEVAKLYYDSTVQTLPKDEERYAAIKIRQEVLTEFVKHLLVMRTNDSLLALSELSLDSIRSWALSKVTADSIAKVLAKEKSDKIAKAQEQRQSNFDNNQGKLINTSSETGWYFNNAASVSRGFTTFERKWKNRTLEDDWRRSIKFANNITTIETVANQPEETKKTEQKVETEVSVAQKTDALVGNVPTTDEEKDILKKGVLDAMYAIGNIYNFKLDEKTNAIETFNELIRRFPKSEYEPEVLYQLYLLQQVNNAQASQTAANRLIREYPESIYAKLIQNPNYREESFAATMQLQEVYKKAYALYKKEEYALSLNKLDSVLAIYPENDFSDNVEMLRILNLGRIEGQYKYQFELDNFVKSYSESELIPYAKTLIQQSDSYKANLYSSSKGKYLANLDQSHYLVLVYPISQENTTKSSTLFKSFISSNNPSLKFANLLLSEEYSMTVINDIESKDLAIKYYNAFNTREKDPLVGLKHYLFVITADNFDIFYKTKDIEGYKTFFDKNYK